MTCDVRMMHGERVAFSAPRSEDQSYVNCGTDLERAVVRVQLAAVLVQEERPTVEPVVHSHRPCAVVAVRHHENVTCNKKGPPLI